MIARKVAEVLDDTAAALYRMAGDAGDRAASVVLAPIRSLINRPCTRCERGICNPTQF